jgi:hypothetical protein
MQKQKLHLDELQVNSFVTHTIANTKTAAIIGASGVGNRVCTTTFYTENPAACETVVDCDTQYYTCGSVPPPPPTGDSPTCGRDCL